MNFSKIMMLLLLAFSTIGLSQDIEIKKTPIVIGGLASGPVEDGEKQRIGTIYNIYTQDNEIYVAIKYGENDFGMFKAIDIKVHKNKSN